MACSATSHSEENNFANIDVLMVFTRMMNSRSAFLASHYLSNNVVLDWFGRTIVGKENVLQYLFEEVHLSEHNIVQVKSDGDSLQKHSRDRALSRFRQPSISEKEEDYELDDDSGFASGPYGVSSDSSFSSVNSDTPCSRVAADLSRLYLSKHKGQASNLSPVSPKFSTPINSSNPSIGQLKRPSIILRSLKLAEVPKNVQFIDAAGILTFSLEEEPYGPTRFWNQRCHLQLGYYYEAGLEESLRFSFLLYHDDMPCRRNLSQIFDQCV